MRNGEEVELYKSIIRELIYMPSIAGGECRNVIGPYDLSLTYHAWRLIRNREATAILDANENNL